MKYYVVKYTGPFGFIKPWTAVRDGLTFSQQFLTPSIIEGIRLLLGVEAIERHRLSYNGLSEQQERTQAPAWEVKGMKGKKGWMTQHRKQSIIVRNVLLDPCLQLAFLNEEDALLAAKHHVCLCRNEDILLPIEMVVMSESEFDLITGFELQFGKQEEDSLLVGYNRYENDAPMYGRLTVTGNASMWEEQ
jgi:hypothetical protein